MEEDKELALIWSVDSHHAHWVFPAQIPTGTTSALVCSSLVSTTLQLEMLLGSKPGCSSRKKTDSEIDPSAFNSINTLCHI